MFQKQLQLCAFLLAGLGMTGLRAQEAIPAAGGNASGSGGSVSFTIGQVVYTTSQSPGGSVAQGVQQPYEIYVATGFEDAKDVNLSVTAFPNPATHHLTLKIEGDIHPDCTASLYDGNGKLLMNIPVATTFTVIPMHRLVPATYFLKVTAKDKELKIFKIIKN